MVKAVDRERVRELPRCAAPGAPRRTGALDQYLTAPPTATTLDRPERPRLERHRRRRPAVDRRGGRPGPIPHGLRVPAFAAPASRRVRRRPTCARGTRGSRRAGTRTAAERGPGLLVRQPLPRPPRRGADRVRRGVRALRAATKRSTCRPTTAPPRRRHPGQRPPRQREHVTPPDGQSPRDADVPVRGLRPGPFRDVNGGDDAAIVYHEYTHGLSNRLITDATGAGALNAAQAGAMGEGWSDWYAKDFLVDQGPALDTAADGEIDMGAYVDTTPHQIRTQPIDCPVGSTAATARAVARRRLHVRRVRRARSAAPSSVHADGEIWGQTLWDLRHGARLGGRGGDDHRRDAPHPAAAVVPRRAQRDPAGRRDALRRRPRRRALGRVRPPRHGLLRHDRRARTTRRPRPDIDAAAESPPPARAPRRRGCRRRHAAGGARERRRAARRSCRGRRCGSSARPLRGRARRHGRLLDRLPRDRDDDRSRATARASPGSAGRRGSPASRGGSPRQARRTFGLSLSGATMRGRAPAACSRWA